MSKIVVALGGNALGKTPLEQMKLLKNVSKIIVKLVKSGNDVVITHGNGPQVGQIALAMEYAANNGAGTPSMPFPECGSMSQGYIGYGLEQCLINEMKTEGITKDVVTLITQVLVDQKDNAFSNPTKPIGMFYSKEEAIKEEKEKGYTFKEDAGRGYRRVVPSPMPIDIIEKETIKILFQNGTLVIACGGGGIPVVNDGNFLKGVEAVIDKDKTAALLAKLIGADTLLILTAVDKVAIHYNTDFQIDLDVLSVKDALKYISRGEFAKGSMLPKIEACLDFVSGTKNVAIISSLEKASDALKGATGTIIKEEN